MSCYLSVLHVMQDKRCSGQDRDASWEESTWYIQVNVLKSVTIMTKRGDRTQAEQIGTQDLDALDMLLKDWYWSSYLDMSLAHWLKSLV